MTTLYGISNCDKVRAARKWLDANGVDHSFHDFRKQGLEEAALRGWIAQCGVSKLLNKQSTSWRQLPDERKTDLDDEAAIQLMLETVTLIKRPVLNHDGSITIGFKPEIYQELFRGNL